MKKSALFLMMSALSLSALALDGVSQGKVLELRVQSGFDRILISQEGAINPADCPADDYLLLLVDESAMQKSMYSALLTAYSTNKEVALGLEGCSTTHAGRPIFSEVWLK